jgi:hypothetical protein
MECVGSSGLNLATTHILLKMVRNKMVAHLDAKLQYLQYLRQKKLKLG